MHLETHPSEKVGLNRNSVLLCLKEFKDGGVENAIYDTPGKGTQPGNNGR
jgi:hypothetical protein